MRQLRPDGRSFALPGPSSIRFHSIPLCARDVNSAFMTRQVFRGLTRFDENLEPVPELAQRIEISVDGLTYRFNSVTTLGSLMARQSPRKMWSFRSPGHSTRKPPQKPVPRSRVPRIWRILLAQMS